MDKPLGQSRLTEYGFPKQEEKVRRNERPIKSICVSCGKERWLNWVKGRTYLCDECSGKPTPKRR